MNPFQRFRESHLSPLEIRFDDLKGESLIARHVSIDQFQGDINFFHSCDSEEDRGTIQRLASPPSWLEPHREFLEHDSFLIKPRSRSLPSEISPTPSK